jgi:hypothetical protein
MNRTHLLPLALIALLASVQCRRAHQSADLYFWSSDTSGAPAYLYIDRHQVGPVPHFQNADAALLRREALHLHLPSGKYHLTLADSNGREIYQETLSFLFRPGHKSVTSGNDAGQGGSRVVLQGRDLLEEFYPGEKDPGKKEVRLEN